MTRLAIIAVLLAGCSRPPPPTEVIYGPPTPRTEPPKPLPPVSEWREVDRWTDCRVLPVVM